MGKLADWSVGYQQPDACAGCGMKTSGREKSDCCKNEQQYVKSATDQQLSSSGFQLIPNIGALLLPVFTELSVASIASLPEVNAVNHAPPRTSSVAVYILHCNYRI